MKNISRPVLAVCCAGLLTAILSLGATSQVQATSAAAKVPYSTIAPILKNNCVSCHNAVRHAEGVDLSSYKAVIAKSGLVVAGHPETSKLFTYVDGSKSPRMPMRKPPLSAKDIAKIKAWIKAGAKS